MHLRTIRKPITVIFGLVLICDLILGYKVAVYKPWINIIALDDGSLSAVSVWNWVDSLLMSSVIIFQIGLAYFVYKSWRTKVEQ
jgi:hypothetical protein